MKNLKLFFVPLCMALFIPFTVAQSDRPAKPNAADAVYPIRDGFVDANGVMIYYMSVGRGQPLVILHGGPGASHDYFLPYLLPLARYNRVIFIDERGSGRSQKLEDRSAYTIENMVEDVVCSGILMVGRWRKLTP